MVSAHLNVTTVPLSCQRKILPFRFHSIGSSTRAAFSRFTTAREGSSTPWTSLREQVEKHGQVPYLASARRVRLSAQCWELKLWGDWPECVSPAECPRGVPHGSPGGLAPGRAVRCPACALLLRVYLSDHLPLQRRQLPLQRGHSAGLPGRTEIRDTTVSKETREPAVFGGRPV